jgi:hypothetical protein
MLSDDHRLKRKQVRYINKIVHTKTSGKPIFDFSYLHFLHVRKTLNLVRKTPSSCTLNIEILESQIILSVS